VPYWPYWRRKNSSLCATEGVWTNGNCVNTCSGVLLALCCRTQAAGLPFPSIPFSLATTSHSATAEVMERHLDTDSDTMPGRGDVLAAA
jgi:hypothetical protein